MKSIVSICILLFVFGCQKGLYFADDTQPMENASKNIVEHIITVKVEGDNPVRIGPPEDKIIRTMEVTNSEGELSPLSFIRDGVAYFKLFSAIGAMDSTRLWQDIIILKSLGINDLKIYINSPGGSATDGLAIADTITRAVSRGMNITTYAVGTCASAALPVFASGKTRIATKSAEFMIHQATLFKYLAFDNSKELESQQEMLRLLRVHYLSILADGSNLSAEEWEEMLLKTTFFTAPQGLEWGLVDRIE
jgi:ATP-dependent protease ClpP protease subunit